MIQLLHHVPQSDAEPVTVWRVYLSSIYMFCGNDSTPVHDEGDSDLERKQLAYAVKMLLLDE